jgi:DNA-binding response OmpR family regulator
MQKACDLRVLIVDDEQVVADTLVAIAAARGYAARAAYSGEEAARIADEFKPHACISDVMMPGMNGLELADWLEDHHPDCKTLLISGQIDTEAMDGHVARHGRLRSILPKPVYPTELLVFLAACQETSNQRGR